MDISNLGWARIDLGYLWRRQPVVVVNQGVYGATLLPSILGLPARRAGTGIAVGGVGDFEDRAIAVRPAQLRRAEQVTPGIADQV
jgi:hypothetical protein